jgi:two-component system response regulator YesN
MSYKLVIIDDDSIIRRGLSTNIPWEKAGFQVVGVAGDGEEGLKLIYDCQPDIVVSDIKMPFMDGLAMSKAVLKAFPTTKIVLLTGYEEFQYAKQALELKIFDYILKPVDYERLLEVIHQATLELEYERKAEWQIRKSRPLLRQRFLTNLINHQCQNETNLREEAQFLGISLPGPYFTVLLIKIDEYYNTALYPSCTEQEILKFSLNNLCTDQLIPGSGEIFDPGGDALVIILYSRDNSAPAKAQIYKFAETLRQTTEEYLKVTITVTFGAPHPGLPGIGLSYKEACSACQFRHFLGKNQIISSEDTCLPTAETPVDISESLKELAIQVKLGLLDEATAAINAILHQIMLQENFISLPLVRVIGLQLAMVIQQTAAEVIIPENFYKYCTNIQVMQTVKEIFAEIIRLAEESITLLNQRRQSQHDGLVEKGVKYIEANYCQEMLSLRDIAQAVHVSPIYFSIIFKKELKINFSDFLTQTRMKKAMELIRTTDLKTYEVAERVGYSNPNYFSICFKKYTGFSPTEFKKF